MAIIKHGNNALANITAFPSAIPTGKPVLLSTATASSSASIEFSSGIDSTYDIYKFEFINMHPATSGAKFTCNASIDNGSNFNVVKTTTFFNAYHGETIASQALQYLAGEDIAQSTGYFNISTGVSNNNDASVSGYFHLFNPSSTTYVKHFISTINLDNANYQQNEFVAGYFNDTNDLTNISFKFSSGNIDAGTIKMYGISA